MKQEYIVKADIIIQNSEIEPIEKGYIAVCNGKIEDIGNGEIPEEFGHYEVLKFDNSLISPSFVNSHSHIAMTILRGIAEDLPLETWLNEYIFPRESKLTEEMIYWGSLLGCWEMIRSGISIVADMYLFEDKVIEAVKSCGMKALAGEGIFDFPSPNYGELKNGFKITEELLIKYQHDDNIKISVNPHALYTCSLDTVKKLNDLALKYNAIMSIHLSESEKENTIIKNKYGRTPVDLLNSEGILNEKTLAAHCVWVSDDEIDILSENNVKISHCPVSNLKLGSGIAPLIKLLESDIIVSIGTDGPASNNKLDILQDMKFASILEKGYRRNPTKPTSKNIFKMATLNGALSLGFSSSGELKKGRTADFVIFDISQPNAKPLYDPINYIIYASSSTDITSTVVNGVFLMKDRKILSIDTDSVTKEIKKISKLIK